MNRPHSVSHPRRLPLAMVLLASLAIAILASCSLSNQSISTPSNRYALVIGVQDYPDSENDSSDLNYTDDDAAELADSLAEQGWTVSTRLISTSDAGIDTDGSPTYANIKAAVEALSTDDSATILVYFSGHGSTDDGTPYIIPYDGLKTSEQYYPGYGYYQDSDITKWITPVTLRSWMDAVPAKNRVLILDSCYSGGFTEDANAVDTSPDDYSQALGTTSETSTLFAALSNFNNLLAANLSSLGTRDVVALSAAGSDEVSWDDSTSGHGAFTNYLLKAAAAGDADGDGYVTVAEAYSYAKAKIKANWNTDYNQSWYRTEWDFLPHISGGTGDIVLYAPEN